MLAGYMPQRIESEHSNTHIQTNSLTLPLIFWGAGYQNLGLTHSRLMLHPDHTQPQSPITIVKCLPMKQQPETCWVLYNYGLASRRVSLGVVPGGYIHIWRWTMLLAFCLQSVNSQPS